MSLRAPASRMSMGRLIPAITSVLPAFSSEMARLEGVPPNRSVRITAPPPLSTCLIALAISLRLASMSSWGPMQTVATSLCLPTTCSIAWTNSSANWPWVTRIMPIIWGCSSRQGGSHKGHRRAPGRILHRSRLVRPFDHFGSARPQVAMENSGRKAAVAQGLRDPFGDEDRAVSPAGTAERDVDVGLSLRGITRQQLEQEVADADEGALERDVALDVARDRLILPGLLAQFRVPVRIVEEADVEHEVGHGRHAARESEAGNGDRH